MNETGRVLRPAPAAVCGPRAFAARLGGRLRRLLGVADGAPLAAFLPALLPLLLQACATGGAPALPSVSTALAPEIAHALSEPSRPAAGTLPLAVAQELLPPPELTLSKLASAPAEPRFDLNVVQLPAAQVFAALAKDTRYSMIVDPELKSPVTVALKDVTLLEAMETLREVYGFEYKIEGTRIFVQAAALETRIFQVNYPNESRNGRSDVRVQSSSLAVTPAAGTSPTLPMPNSNGSMPGQAPNGNNANAQESSRITTQIRNDLWAEVQASLRLLIPAETVKPEGRQMIVSPQSGVIVVRALPTELRQVERYLRSMRLSIERQIILESKIIEVDLNHSTQTGINWAAFHAGPGARTSAGMSTPGSTLAPTGAISDSLLAATPGTMLAQGGSTVNPLFGIAFQTNNFAGLLEFLETQGQLQVLSSPRITAMNNQQAVLKVGTENFFVTGVTTNIASGAGTGGSAVITPTITVQPFFSGVALDVIPSIDEDGSVILHVHPSVSNVTQNNLLVNLGTLGSYTLPLASSTVSETDTVVRVHDGNIVAIGGLMKLSDSDSSSGVPGLGNLPGVGYLFSSKEKSRTKQELVILIKPTVVQSDGQADATREDLRHRIEADLSASAR